MENKNTDILLVEDNPYEAKLAIMSLKENNPAHNLTHVEDGAEALDFIFAKGIFAERIGQASPKVILLDLNMPKISGLEVLRQIKSNELTKSIPIVILSSSKLDADLISAYEMGVNSYVVKPVDFDEFAKAMADLGSYWLELSESAVLLMPAKAKIVA